mgnify:CR=1 FL=1
MEALTTDSDVSVPLVPENANDIDIEALSAWLECFALAKLKRKHASCELMIVDEQLLVRNDTQGRDYWMKQVSTILKKVEVEHIRTISGEELWDNIPEQDADGRGRLQLTSLQKELMVLSFFAKIIWFW